MTPVSLSADEAAVLLQSLDATARSGQIDATIRQGGLHAVASFSTLAEKLRDAANAPAQQPAEADMEAKQENP